MSKKRLVLIGVSFTAVVLAGSFIFLANKGGDNTPAKPDEPTTISESADALPEPDVEAIEQAFNDGDFEAMKPFLPEGAEIAETYDIKGQIVIDPVCMDPIDPADQSTACPNPASATYRSYSAQIVADDGQIIQDNLELVLFLIDDKWVIVDFQ